MSASSIPVTHTGMAVGANDATDGVAAQSVASAVVGSNLAKAAICLPGSITKNKRSHTFPIGNMASDLLGGLPCISFMFLARGSDPTDPKPFNGWNKRKALLDKRVGDILPSPAEPWTLHDLRRTYATNLQRLGVKLEVIEALLNHVSGTRAGIVGVYQRHAYGAEMREAVEKFEEWLHRTILR